MLTDLTLVYGGGAAMFWYHSYFLGEGGPAISPYLHWFVDSTVGLVGLTPVLVVILPIAARAAWDAAPARAPYGSPDVHDEQSVHDGEPATVREPTGASVRPVVVHGDRRHPVRPRDRTRPDRPRPPRRPRNLAGRRAHQAVGRRPTARSPPPVRPGHGDAEQEAFGLPLYPALLGVLLVAAASS